MPTCWEGSGHKDQSAARMPSSPDVDLGWAGVGAGAGAGVGIGAAGGAGGFGYDSAEATKTTEQARQAGSFRGWSLPVGEAADRAWAIADNDSPTLEYVDLVRNPEGYTGYAGPKAHRIWRSVYEENCFEGGPEPTPVPLASAPASAANGSCAGGDTGSNEGDGSGEEGGA